MVTFNPYHTQQGTAFELELARVSALVADMEKIRSGVPPERLAQGAPILDHWVMTHRSEVCLAGLSTGHPRLTGTNRPIVTSDLWLVSKGSQWARTLSRWYRLGRPGDASHNDA